MALRTDAARERCVARETRRSGWAVDTELGLPPGGRCAGSGDRRLLQPYRPVSLPHAVPVRGLGLKVRHDHKAVDLPAQEGLQELRIVLEGYASKRLAGGTEHVGMGENAVAPEHPSVIDGIEANGLNTVKGLLAQHQIVDVRRRGSAIFLIDVARIIQSLTQPGVRLELEPVGQIDRVRFDVVDRRAAVGVGQ
jgi:hypothetical protein